MKPKYFSFIFLVAVISFSGCAEKIVTECEPDPELFPAKISASLNDIQQKIFTPSCALSGCHAGTAPVLGMNLSAGQAFANIVDVASTQEPALKRVLPGNSSQSYLIKKLTASNTSVMPPGGQLTGALIDSVRAWIDAGAENN